MAASTRSCDPAVTLRSQATYLDGAVRQERWLLPQDGFGCTTLGYPIGKDLGDAPAGRAVYIPANRNVPDAAWNTDKVWLLRTTYRTRDLQAVRIEGEPVPLAKASGMRTWTWQSNEPLLRPAVEAAIGIALMLGAAIGLLTRRVRLMHHRSTSPIFG